MNKKQILNEEQKKKEVEQFGTQWPAVIGAKRHEGDGKIRDSRGLLLEETLVPKR